MNSKFKIQNSKLGSEQGVIALFIAAVMSILMVVTTTYASRVMLSELQQASQIDRSEQAYYAALAGIQEASRRLDQAEFDTCLSEIFPEASRGQHGDSKILSDTEGQWSLDSLPQPDNSASNVELGQLAWRWRRVRPSTLLVGTQIKDESIELDTGKISRLLDSQTSSDIGCSPAGNAETATDLVAGKTIFDHFIGLRYCWNETALANIEFSVISRSKTNASDIKTEKIITDGNPPAGSKLVKSTINEGAYQKCVDYPIDTTDKKNRRYIFRIKPLFVTGQIQNQAVNYFVKLLDEKNTGELYLPDDSFEIDVMGQSGDIRRRLVAKKDRSGRLLGVFDYVLYSGDPEKPLCKAGVQQTDVGYGELCNVVGGQ